MIGFSIIICTHNPKHGIFKRVLTAIEQLQTEAISHEIIIVDNNSTTPLTTINFVQEFLKSNSTVSLILEKKPGLTEARIAGIKRAKYDWFVFFDDDNEPKSDYLQRASHTIHAHPQVGAWGPGTVEVEFMDPPPPWLESEKWLFQHRKEVYTEFDNQKNWQKCYPFGTGLIIRKDIAALYVKRVLQNRYTLSDRKGKSLASGGDVQMVLTGIEQGYSAGVIKGMVLNHLIDASKTTMKYLLRMQYGTASAYIKAFNQVFINDTIPIQRVTNKQIFFMLYSLFKIQKKQMKWGSFKLLLASKMGEINASIEANGQIKPFFLRFFEKFSNVS